MTTRKLQYLLSIAAASALAAGSMPVAWAASATANASATVLTPMTITKSTDLNFGELVAGNGVVTLDTAGARTKAGSTALPTGGSPTAARFDVTGDANHTFSVDFATGSSTVLTDASSNTMAVSWFAEVVGTAAPTPVSTGTPTTGTLNSGAAYIYVGGAVTVGASQAAGSYTGTIQVTVNYN
ncbi:DUF4402 domain-containing protein [Pelomonas sp. KK5]|uniref:DUF4402 domain-containing protein n=1 Tax=Pelomonas sp. KK5 TaxID=1855730 RepID=UPI00097CA094|nr:DUF4402 domain-containing protein [Pelomonas sp. KK5]